MKMPSESARWCTVSAVLAILICCSNALVILEPQELAGMVIETPRIKTIGPMDWSYIIVAELVGPDASNLTGKIILIDIPAGLSQEDMARKFNLTGSLGVITAFRNEVPYAGLGSFIWDGSNSSLVYTPSAELNMVDFRFLEPYITNGTRLLVNFTSYDENPWDPVMGPGAIAFTSVLMPLTAASLSFSIYKYYTWLRYKGFQWSFVQVVLLANIIGNIVRLLSVSIDPIFSRRLMPNVVNNLFLTGSWPFALTATLLISFYWQELITKNRVQVSLFVRKLKIPFWIIVALIFAMEFTSSMLRGLYYPLGALTTLTGVVYIVSSIAISLLYFISGGRIVQALKKSAAARVEKVPTKLTKTTERVVASGSLMVIFAIIVAVIGLSDILYIPWGFWSAWFSVTILLNINSVLQVAAFNVPNKSHPGTGGSSTDLSRISNTNQSIGSVHAQTEGSISDN